MTRVLALLLFLAVPSMAQEIERRARVAEVKIGEADNSVEIREKLLYIYRLPDVVANCAMAPDATLTLQLPDGREFSLGCPERRKYLMLYGTNGQ